ncbi:MAG: DNA polymerase III subunit delta [Candidatus Coatesbacteria bacterium]|nr:DNA polymerase III subunit delta [Candidatus Coatesbacteria bacterium]
MSYQSGTEGSDLTRIRAVVAAIKADKCPPVFFLYGQEGFLVSRAKDDIIAALRKRAGAAAEFISLPGATGDLNLILTEVLSGSLFSSDKIVSVPEFKAITEKSPKAKDRLTEFAMRLESGLPKGKALILSIAEGGTTIAAFARRLKKALVLGFPKLKTYPGMQAYRDPLFAFIKDFLAESKKTITQDGFFALKESVGTDLSAICSELEKLVLYLAGKERIDAKDVEAIVSESRQQAVFELTDAIANKRAVQAFRALANLLQEGTAPLLVIQSLASQFRSLLQARILISEHLEERQIATMSFFNFRDDVMKGLEQFIPLFGSSTSNLLTKPPFVIHKTLQLAASLKHDEITQALIKVSDADLEIKRSPAAPTQILRTLMFDLIQKEKAG